MISWNCFHGFLRKACWLHHLPEIYYTSLKSAMLCYLKQGHEQQTREM